MNKKSFVLILSILFFPLSWIYAQEATVTPDDEIVFSVSPVTAYKNGMLGEYVYVKDVNNQEQKLSELDWEIKNLFLIGADFSVGFKNFIIDLNVLFGIKNQNGKMQDSDWLNYLTEYDFIDPLVKTNYSISSLELKNNINADLTLFYKFYDDEQFCLLPYFAINIDYIDFSAYGGEGWYGSNDVVNPPVSWDSPLAKHYTSGQLGGVDYTRQTYSTLIGIKNKFNFNKFHFDIDLAVSPFLYISSLDVHSSATGIAGSFFDDEIFGFFSLIRLNSLLQFDFTKNSSIFLGIEYSALTKVQGTTFVSTNKKNWYKKTSCYAKADGETWQIKAGYRFSF